MNFLNPLALFGLIAGLIPVILHFLNLRKLKVIEFSTLRFLKELQKTKIRRLKIKQWLILLCRTLAVLFTILALSRPHIEGTIPGFSSFSKTSSVIIIDDSYSMDISDESGNRFNKAKQVALQILNSFKEGDEAAILRMSNQNAPFKLTHNIFNLKDYLNKIQVSFGNVNLYNSIKKAIGLLHNAKNPNKEIFIISDAQSNIFRYDGFDTIKMNQKIPVYFVKIAENSNKLLDNISIDSVEVKNRIFQYDKNVETEVTLRNASEKSFDNLIVNLKFNNERIAQRNINIKPKASQKLIIVSSPKTYGVVKSEIEIEDDILNIDNKRYFGFYIPDKPKVAVFGDNKNNFFLNLILNNNKIKSPAETKFFSSDKLLSINLNDYEIIIVSSGDYNLTGFSKLENYINQGGNLIYFANIYKTSDDLLQGLAKLGIGKVIYKEFPDNNPVKFSNIEKIHPLFEGVFKGTTDNKKIVESPLIYKVLLNNEGFSIISIPGGNFLSEIKLGKGKILYFAVPPTMEWSNFPVTGLFPTLIIRSIYYLSTREGLGTFSTIGQPLRLQIPLNLAIGNSIIVIDPTGQKNIFPIIKSNTNAIAVIDGIEQPGVYSVYNSNNRLINIISYNVPKEESILNFLDDDKIINILKTKLTDASSINVLYKTKNIMTNINRIRQGTELWQLAIILSLICLLTEMFIGRNTKNEIID